MFHSLNLNTVVKWSLLRTLEWYIVAYIHLLLTNKRKTWFRPYSLATRAHSQFSKLANLSRGNQKCLEVKALRMSLGQWDIMVDNKYPSFFSQRWTLLRCFQQRLTSSQQSLWECSHWGWALNVNEWNTPY